MATALPSTRQFLTSLINTLTSSAHVHPHLPRVNEPHNADTDSTNPLKHISIHQKALLATMHVVFPPPMLLQALDLLDRGLVMRIIERYNQDGDEDGGELRGGEMHRVGVQDACLPQANIQLSPPSPHNGSSPPWPATDIPLDVPALQPIDMPQAKRSNLIHQVRSSQAPKSRFSHPTSASGTGRPGSSGGGSSIGGGGPGAVYTVRLQAWNCSCAAFAFSSFPASASSSTYRPWNLAPNSEDSDNDEELADSREQKIEAARRREQGGTFNEEEEEEWEFGGVSLNGRCRHSGMEREESVPICKHLLACLLGERWGQVLGRYVDEKIVSREEMAGLGGEG